VANGEALRASTRGQKCSASVPVSRGVGVVELGEGPLWDAGQQCLWWVDILGGDLFRYDTQSGNTDTWHVGGAPACLARRTDRSMLIAFEDGVGSFDPTTGKVELLVPVEQGKATSRLNDGTVDPAGRFWVGSMQIDGQPESGTLYRLDSDLKLTATIAGVSISNGIDWSPDARTMYYIDTLTQRIDVFDFDLDSGDITNRRPLVDVPRSAGTPDGLTVDAEGDLWVAMFGGSSIHRYAPDGRLRERVELPVSNITSCAFGGPALGDLFITSATSGLTDEARRAQPDAGAVFRVRVSAQGRTPNAFRG
jgi:sugar lactone lactonase YvrE